MNREQRRELKKKKTSDEEKKLSDKIFLFKKLPDHCSVCSEPFDKTDKKMAFSWKVVVRQESVRLFCPQCTAKAKEVVDGTQKNQ
tara:strand:- start:2000 stop:2254 length:255 start_codon:yes stop_codon:yes gene_type:complete